jgi:hypothetical protein
MVTLPDADDLRYNAGLAVHHAVEPTRWSRLREHGEAVAARTEQVEHKYCPLAQTRGRPFTFLY